jgi:hypothetical protein
MLNWLIKKIAVFMFSSKGEAGLKESVHLNILNEKWID